MWKPFKENLRVEPEFENWNAWQTLRRALRFSIRDILLMTLVFGLALGWWLDHRSLSAASHREIEVLRATVYKERTLREMGESRATRIVALFHAHLRDEHPDEKYEFIVGRWDNDIRLRKRAADEVDPLMVDAPK